MKLGFSGASVVEFLTPGIEQKLIKLATPLAIYGVCENVGQRNSRSQFWQGCMIAKSLRDSQLLVVFSLIFEETKVCNVVMESVIGIN